MEYQPPYYHYSQSKRRYTQISLVKILMKNIPQNVIKYLTYLILNKRKLKNKQTHVPLLKGMKQSLTQQMSPPRKWHNTYSCITEDRDQQ